MEFGAVVLEVISVYDDETKATISILSVKNHLFRRLVVCILVQEENWHTSSGWVLLFFFSSLFCDRPVDEGGYFLSEVYVHVGCPHLARCGENKIKD